MWSDDHGKWLLARSSVLEGLGREAVFLIGLPDYPNLLPWSWGFWDCAGELTWIGSRHTNFPDGSICAFSPQDDVWAGGDDLITLIGLYTTWALRHAHLELVGRWPGKQYSLPIAYDHPANHYYRLAQFGDDELCSCTRESSRYGSCCKPKDLRLDLLTARDAFEEFAGCPISERRPPAAVVDFVQSGKALPPLNSVHRPLISYLFDRLALRS